MTGGQLREARQRKGWTQQLAAQRLGISQGYLSLLERGFRKLPHRHLKSVLKTYTFFPLALPLHGEQTWAALGNRELAEQLSALGYPGFSYIRVKAGWNPAELLLAALSKDDLERRVAEALPWLILEYSDMDWQWVIRESKLRDSQNRLGFAVTLAREVAEQKALNQAATRLRPVEAQLTPALLARRGTFCHENMTQAEKKWLQRKSSPQARRWNILSDLAPEQLAHAA